MIDVEDWAEIRRLRWAERMPVKVIARVLGVRRTGEKGAGRRRSAGVSATGAGLGGGSG